MRFRVKKDAVYSNDSAVPSGTVDKGLTNIGSWTSCHFIKATGHLIPLRLAFLYLQQTWTQGGY